jgi:hypothetical protein
VDWRGKGIPAHAEALNDDPVDAHSLQARVAYARR